MKALVLSGGGSKGAYQAGALKHIIGELNIAYDLFCGVSVGALNCSILSMFKYGHEKLSADALVNLWQTVDTSKVYKRWFPFGRLHALWKSSFYNSKPLQDWIKGELDLDRIRKSGKNVHVGAVSLTTGEYKVFHQDYDDFISAVIASSSYPSMLVPIEFDGQLWSDGGVKQVTPIRTAIDLGATEIDVVITSPKIDSDIFPISPNAINVLKRSMDLMSDEIISNDIHKTLMYNKLVESGYASDKRVIKFNIIRPSFSLTNDSLDFDPEKIKEMMNIGYSDAVGNYVKI